MHQLCAILAGLPELALLNAQTAMAAATIAANPDRDLGTFQAPICNGRSSAKRHACVSPTNAKTIAEVMQ
jgi:hypothetical protein